MITLKKTSSTDIDFIGLVNELNTYLKIVDGEDHAFYNQYNNIDAIKHVLVAYLDSLPLGCGTFKIFNQESVEIKRMYTKPEYRGKGVATKVLKGLEGWAKELSYKSCVLETGKRQIEAIKFYRKNGYQVIPNFGLYKNVSNSICFEKKLNYEKG